MKENSTIYYCTKKGKYFGINLKKYVQDMQIEKYKTDERN